MSTVKVIIAGGRNFDDYDQLRLCCDSVLDPYILEDHNLVFISGRAEGADVLGERYAKEEHRVRKVVPFRPNYARYSNQMAPLKRNQEMAEYATGGILIAFLSRVKKPAQRGGGSWTVQGKYGGGTANMIMHALANGMEVHIFRYGESDVDTNPKNR